MKTVRLPLGSNSYNIITGKNIISKFGASVKKLSIGKDAIIITNPVIKKLYGSKVSSSLKRSGISVQFIEVPDGEKSKSAKCAFYVIEKIAQYDVLKKPFIIALGGGVIGDLAGYIASAYKRGIPFVQVPTTFLAQIDSAIGGKVAIDLPAGKNLVGAFFQPKLVFSDVAFLSSLSNRQIKNGLAEAVKYGIIADEKLFSLIEKDSEKLLDLDSKLLEELVVRCSRIKAKVVSLDEKEKKGIRTILNFGHTAGHAVEAACKYNAYQHGEAVALGMRIAAGISRRTKLLSADNELRINCVLDELGLPDKIKKVQLADILKIMMRDKKFISGKNRFVLVREIGKVKVVEGIKTDIIKSSVKELM